MVGPDDVGTGFSLLAYLRQSTLDVAKIDRSLIEERTRGGSEEAIIAAILDPSHALALFRRRGVMTHEQLDVPRSHGGDRAKGVLKPSEGEPASGGR